MTARILSWRRRRHSFNPGPGPSPCLGCGRSALRHAEHLIALALLHLLGLRLHLLGLPGRAPGGGACRWLGRRHGLTHYGRRSRRLRWRRGGVRARLQHREQSRAHVAMRERRVTPQRERAAASAAAAAANSTAAAAAAAAAALLRRMCQLRPIHFLRRFLRLLRLRRLLRLLRLRRLRRLRGCAGCCCAGVSVGSRVGAGGSGGGGRR
jgi:hypothetical protein